MDRKISMKLRNHLATICMKYVRLYNPEDFKVLANLAYVNYESGQPVYVADTILHQFSQRKKVDSTTNDL